MKERGFQVTVYEKDSSFGGKAKSLVVPSNGIACLPAEHGFRFFPGFYRHLIDTLARIPVREVAGKYVVENLVTVREGVIAQADKRFSLFPTKGPQTVRAGVRFLRELLENPSLGLGAGEASFAALKLATAMTTCQERRTAELDDVTWWDYMWADNMSVTIEGWSSIALREILLPCHAEQTSLRTAVTILARLFQDFITGRGIDSVLNGPTSKVWIDHWLSYLEATAADQFPVGLRPDTRVASFIFDEASGRICGLQLANGEHVLDEEAIYIAAVPVEAMVQILKNGPASLLEHSPTLKLLFDDFLKVNRMSGILYYLKSDSPTARGHILYLDSSWALTSISQNQFWSRKLDSYGKGQMHGVVSAIISDWFADGNGGVWSKTAQEADNEDEIVDEALAQIRAHIVAREGIGLEQANIGGHFLDPALKFAKIRERLLGLMSAADFIRRVTQIQQEAGKDKIKSKSIAFVAGNVEPLFINTVGSWLYRPTEATDIENLFLASDYVRTNTDLATMEGANESGRRAVNRILSLLRVPGRRCRVFRFDEPAVFAPLRALDERCFRLGLPHPSLMFGCP